MNQSIFLTKDAFNSLLTNLVELEEGINEILTLFFHEVNKESEELKLVLNDYIRWLDSTLNRITVVDTANNDFPYVVIGSEVIVEDLEGKGINNYKLVSPLRNSINSYEISFLSPMGKTMLLKRVGDRFVVNAPGGDFEYKIIAVRITTDSTQDNTNELGKKSYAVKPFY